jgi:hypothetical protein
LNFLSGATSQIQKQLNTNIKIQPVTQTLVNIMQNNFVISSVDANQLPIFDNNNLIMTPFTSCGVKLENIQPVLNFSQPVLSIIKLQITNPGDKYLEIGTRCFVPGQGVSDYVLNFFNSQIYYYNGKAEHILQLHQYLIYFLHHI